MNPIDRLKQAFASNNIPWDEALNRLPQWKQTDLAMYWEDKALQPPIEVFEGEQLREAAARVLGMSKKLGLGGLTGAYLATTASEARYCG